MTKEEMISRLNGMGMEDDYMVLSTYLDIAGEAILNRLYPYAKDDEELTVPRKYQGLQVEICAYLVNRRGAEGQVQHIENGIHRNWGSADIPDDMLSRIVPMVGVIGE